MRKRCRCGQDRWDGCDHPWAPTDAGAAVVVKGPSRIYWAHKASVASLSNSEIPIDARVCQYAAQSDGKTLMPHLELLARHFSQLIMGIAFILADSAYQDNHDAVAEFDNKPRLIVPVRGRTERAIKRLKVDLDGQRLTHRDAARVQAYLDRRLLTLHLLLAAAAFP